MTNKTPAVRNDKGHFVKGVSGNPSGRPQRMLPDGNGGFISKTELFQKHTVDVVETLARILHDDTEKTRDRLVAGKILLEHGVGTPKQHIEVNTTDDSGISRTVAAADMDIDMLRKLVNAEIVQLDAEIVDPDSDDE